MKKIKTKVKAIRKPKQKKYGAHYLGIVLALALMLEGALFNISTQKDWQQAVSILDMSSAVSETAQDMKAVFQPQVDLVMGVNDFYQISAKEMTPLLDLSDSGMGLEVVQIYDGVGEFYQQSSIILSQLLGIPQSRIIHPSVSGAAITSP